MFTDTTAKPSAAFSYKIKTGSSVSNERAVTLPADRTATMALQPRPRRERPGGLHFYSGYTACDNAGAEPRLLAGTTATDKYRQCCTSISGTSRWGPPCPAPP